MSKPLIPFSLTPTSWSLKGDAYREAEARYYHHGYELDEKLAEIRFSGKELEREMVNIRSRYGMISAFDRDMQLLTIDGKQNDDRALLEVHHRHQKTSDYDYDQGIARLDHRAGTDRDIALLGVELNHNKISPYEYDAAVERINNPVGPMRDAALLRTELKHGRMSQYDFDVATANLQPAGVGRDKLLLGIDLRHEKITPYDHEAKLIDLTKVGPERERALLDLDYREGKLNDYDYAVAGVALETLTDEAREEKLLVIKHDHQKIDDNEYQKGLATLKNEPWIGIIDSGFDPSQGVNGVYFEFDWNEQWITFLRQNGYSGPSDAVVVDMWFADVCRAQGLQSQNAYGLVPFSL